MAKNNEENKFIKRLKELLKTLFQLDCGELDFGIYRIMNYRRQEIEKFIENDLIQVVEREFEKYKTQNEKEVLEKIEEKRKEIKRLEKELGEKILKNDEIEDKFKEKPFAKEYLGLRKQFEDIEITEAVKTQVFNDLYEFFSRYYEDGDFISQRRYSSKQHRYAIPYNGEEVKLYWANFDQYYIKTGEVFKDYEFNLKDWRITFRTNFAEVVAGNVKAERRYFLLSQNEPLKVDIENQKCLIQFEYRPLTDDDLKIYKIKTKEGKEKETGIKQEELNAILKEKILEEIKDNRLKAVFLGKKENDEKERTILEWNLEKYTRKVTSDFFIHKNLKGFLERELDYFIKTEVVDLNNLEPRHITRAKVVEGIGKWIIEFLHQIEEFQKILWVKKKFVLRTDYVITTDRVPEEFYEEIWKNKEQKKEWEELGFEIPGKKEELKNKKLPIDTKYFSPEFKEKFLEKLTQNADLDDLLDGLLIKSENWQALNLLLGKYKEKVQTIYIDPPFNKEQEADYLYKVGYKDSTWITMLYNSIELARRMMSDKASIFVRCDYNGNMLVRLLMNEIFGEENFRNEIGINRTKKIFTGVKGYNVATDNLFFYTKKEDFKFCAQYKQRGQEQKWLNMHSPGERRPPERIIFGKLLYPPKGRHWTFIQETIDKMIEEGRIRIKEDVEYIDLMGNKVKGMPQYLTGEEELLDSNWTDIPGYSQTQGFPTENSEILLKRVIESTSNEGDLVMDFFLGSGTTTAVAHKLKRKWIGVEMGEHFWTVVLPRMKKVLAYDKSGISKEKDVKEKYNDKSAGGFFKYQVLEQYEDSLHNVEFLNEEKGKKARELFEKSEAGQEYLMKYFLKYETEGSPSLLNLKQFDKPFEYKLKIISSNKGEEVVNVDLVETFNYLIGLKVNKYKFLKDNGRKYVIVLGEKQNRKTAIVWRETTKLNLEKDKEIIEKAIGDYNPEAIFINGDFYGEKNRNYKLLETEFKALMEV